MAIINVQFHSLPGELIEFAKVCATTNNLFSIGMVFSPNFKVNVIEDYTSLQNIEKINRICLCRTKPDLSAKSVLDFSRKNPDCLSLSIGRYDDDGLVESSIGANTDNKDDIKIWRKIVKQFKKITLEGAWVVNPHTNAKEFYKKHRYTEAAKKIADKGVTIKPLAGWNYFILDENL